MDHVRLHQQAIALKRILLTRTVVARTIFFRGVDVEIARRQIRASQHLKGVTHAISIGVCQARTVARISALGEGARTVVHVGDFVEVARLGIHASFQRQRHTDGLHKHRRVAAGVRGRERALKDNLQAIVAQRVFQHHISGCVVASVGHQGLCGRHHFTRKFIHLNCVLGGEQEQRSLEVKHREHHGVHKGVSRRIGGLVHPGTEVTLQASEGVLEGTVDHPFHAHRSAIVRRLRHGQRRIWHGVRTRQGVGRGEEGPHRRFHVHTIVHRIANPVTIHIAHQACSRTIEAILCIGARFVVDICRSVKIARHRVGAAFRHTLAGAVVVVCGRVKIRGQLVGATAGVVGRIRCARPLDLNRTQLCTRGSSSGQHLGLELNEHVACRRQLPQPNSALVVCRHTLDTIQGPAASHLVVEQQACATLERRPRRRVSEQRQFLTSVSNGQMRIVRTSIVLKPCPGGRDDQRRTSLAQHRC